MANNYIKSNSKISKSTASLVCILLAIVAMPIGLYAQHLAYPSSNIVFVDHANLRAEPKLSSQIVGVLPHGYPLQICEYSPVKEDTIDGKQGYWHEVKWMDGTAFIWQHLKADGQIINKTTPQFKIIFKIVDSIKVSFKIFENDKYLKEIAFNIEPNGRSIGFYNYGKTWNSKGKEIFAIVFYKGNYLLYEWQGKTIEKSNIQLADESLLTGEYLPFKQAIVNAQSVHIRKGPSDTSALLGTLAKYSRFELSKPFVASEKNGHKYYRWHSVEYKDTVAFIRADYLDIPYRYSASNYTKDLHFLSTSNAIYVFKNGEMLDRCKAFARDEDQLENFGNRGFEDKCEFIAICHSANSCGEEGGDRYYRWDGRHLKFFCNDYSVGDGGYADGHDFIFPDEEEQLNNQVKLVIWSGENVGESNKGCEVGYSDVISEETYYLQFDGDTLVEVPTEHTRVRNLIKSEFAEYFLNNYWFYDLNNDGIDDVVFHLVDRNYYESLNQVKPEILGYAFGSKNQFSEIHFTQKLIQPGLHNALFAFENGQLKMTLRYHLGWEFDQSSDETRLEEFWYAFDAESNRMIWKRYRLLKNMASKEDRGIVWGNEKSQVFNKNKVFFEKTWSVY